MYDQIAAFLKGKPPLPRAAIFQAVPRATPYLLNQSVKSKRLRATGATHARRYSLPSPSTTPPAPAGKGPELEVVWDGQKGQSLSSHQQRPRG